MIQLNLVNHFGTQSKYSITSQDHANIIKQMIKHNCKLIKLILENQKSNVKFKVKKSTKLFSKSNMADNKQENRRATCLILRNKFVNLHFFWC